MPRKAGNRPTDTELAILRVLWGEGPSTVRGVHQRLAAERPVGYTTVLKLLQIMTDKGLVRRDESSRAHVYEATSSKDEIQRHLVGDLLDRAFEGTAGRLVMQALEARPASDEEIEEIRCLLDARERGSS
jgi:BlaI family penicillinase repressor